MEAEIEAEASQPGVVITDQPLTGQAPQAPGRDSIYTAPVVLMPAPAAPFGGDCPPGLEYLSQLDQVLMEQEGHALEILTGFGCKNKFRIMNSQKQQVLYAAEESDLCSRLACGPTRGFVFHITDNNKEEVLRVRRDFQCCKGCFCCPCDSCRYFAAVEDRNGQVLGYVSDLQFCCAPLLGIYDAELELVGKVKGPCCPFQAVCCTGDVDFMVIEDKTGAQIGTLTKVWEGFVKATFTKADNFRLSFPISMDVRKKAILIASVFIIDMMVYEQQMQQH